MWLYFVFGVALLSIAPGLFAAPCVPQNLAAYEAGYSCDISGVTYSNFTFDWTGFSNTSEAQILVTPNLIDGGFTFTSPTTPTSIAGLNGFGTNSSVTYTLFYFAQTSGPMFITGVQMAVNNLQTQGTVSLALAEKRVSTGVPLGNFDSNAGVTVGQSQAFLFGMNGSDVANASEAIFFAPTQLIRIRDTMTVVGVGGQAGIEAISNSPVFTTTIVPEPASMGLLGIGLLGILMRMKRFRRS